MTVSTPRVATMRASGDEPRLIMGVMIATWVIKPSAAELAAPGPIIKQHLHRRRLATITAVREQFGPNPIDG